MTTAFIAKLLAPIPAHEEQADTPQFRKWLVQIDVAVWCRMMERVERAAALHKLIALNLRDAGRHDPRHTDCLEAYCAYRAAVEAQCLIPAPTEKEARWKRRVMKGHKIPAHVSAAMKADDERLSA
ncbi:MULTISPECIES: hypothetical protein [unclassified Sphingobium]|uniref:hypothetical protein n=1 Tax=unclassified Sphingobium TaxID=2611147 RepID=UPI0035A62C9D